MFALNIPDPCHENWNEMTPEGKGRFCGSCQKVVVDFTLMTDDEVKNYFFQNHGNHICGRFYTTQLNRPLENKSIQLDENWYRKLSYPRQVFYAIALFFVLGISSCDWIGMGAPARVEQADTVKQENNQITGEIMLPPPIEDSVSPIPPIINHIVPYTIPQPISGDVRVEQGIPEFQNPPEPVTMGGAPVQVVIDTPVQSNPPIEQGKIAPQRILPDSTESPKAK